MASLQDAFPSYCDHLKAAVICREKNIVHCKACDKKIMCDHSYGTYSKGGVWNGAAPKYCKLCMLRLNDTIGQIVVPHNNRL